MAGSCLTPKCTGHFSRSSQTLKRQGSYRVEALTINEDAMVEITIPVVPLILKADKKSPMESQPICNPGA